MTNNDVFNKKLARVIIERHKPDNMNKMSDGKLRDYVQSLTTKTEVVKMVMKAWRPNKDKGKDLLEDTDESSKTHSGERDEYL